MSTTTFDTLPETTTTADGGVPRVAAAGRVLFTVPFVVSGLFHLASPGAMAGAVPAWVPGGGALWVVLTGLAMLAASASFVTDRLTRWSGPLLALLLVVYVLTLHLPELLGGDASAMPSITKDLGLAGAALAIALRKR